MGGLVTFESRFPDGRDLLMHAASNPSTAGDLSLPSGKIQEAPVAVAEVNHGRWIAKCPLVYAGVRCSGAELVSVTSGLFFCCGCRNAAVGHAYLRVSMPNARSRAAIDRTLTSRPLEESRNWNPGEKLATLEAENRERGV